MLSLRFMLVGKVQGVKMRRYVQATARHFNLAGFVLNTPQGHVYGEAAGEQATLEHFEMWMTGKWEPKTFTDIKPTPVGTAYPSRARTTGVAVEYFPFEDFQQLEQPYRSTFCMIREEKGTRDLLPRIPTALYQLERTIETPIPPEPAT